MTENEHRKAARRAKRNNQIIFAVLTCLLLIVVFALCVIKYQHTFSKSKWEASKGDRYKIVNDMLDSYQLIGMSESDVIQLLGEEDSNEQTSFKISKQYFPPDSTLVYYLGVDFVDDNWLILSINGDVVTEYYLDVT